MWQIRTPRPARLIVGMLACDEHVIDVSTRMLEKQFGPIDLKSQIWPFSHTEYYEPQMGSQILRRFISHARLVRPDQLAQIKLMTNDLEQQLAKDLSLPLPRPVNLDPGLIETSRLTLATTKDYCHRIYIGSGIYAEVTLIFSKGAWLPMPYTYPDYRQGHYHTFFSSVRQRLVEQLRDDDAEDLGGDPVL